MISLSLYFIQSKKNIFNSLEKILGEAFNDNIPEILTAAGFDTKTSLKSMNIQCITAIENFINQNKNQYQEILKGTKYENTEIFKFLPGHCALILSLPEYIQALSSKNVRGKKRKHCETIDHPPSSNTDHPSAHIDGAEIDVNVKTKIKQELINKINNFSTNKNINVQIQDHHILNFRCEDDSYKCSVQCSVCEKIVPCKYNTHWVCGNFETHLKKHSIPCTGQYNLESYEVQDNSSLKLIAKNQHPQIAITRIGNNKDLYEVLNSK